MTCAHTVEVVELEPYGPDVQPPAWWRGRRRKWQRRKPDAVRHWCWHQTAVEGGLGARDFEHYLVRLRGRGPEKRGVPYSYVYSPRWGVVVAVTHPTWRGDHGNGGNKGIGIAIDGKYPTEQLQLDIKGLESAWRAAVHHAAGLGFAPTLLTSHRQHSNQRGGDPGAAVWRVIERVGAELGLSVDERTTGTGLPLPAEWRPGWTN